MATLLSCVTKTSWTNPADETSVTLHLPFGVIIVVNVGDTAHVSDHGYNFTTCITSFNAGPLACGHIGKCCPAPPVGFFGTVLTPPAETNYIPAGSKGNWALERVVKFEAFTTTPVRSLLDAINDPLPDCPPCPSPWKHASARGNIKCVSELHCAECCRWFATRPPLWPASMNQHPQAVGTEPAASVSAEFRVSGDWGVPTLCFSRLSHRVLPMGPSFCTRDDHCVACCPAWRASAGGVTYHHCSRLYAQVPEDAPAASPPPAPAE